MRVTKFKDSQEMYSTLSATICEMDQRERIVLKFPFGSSVNRIEIYCGETVNTMGSAMGEMISGSTLNGPTSISVFNDYTNKPASKSSYTYKNDILKHLHKVSEATFKILSGAVHA